MIKIASKEMIIIKQKEDLQGTNRVVETENWKSTRLLLREDSVGLTLTDVVIKAGSEAIYQYKNHLEICYCIEGDATLEEFETGKTFNIRSGSLWASPNHEKIRFIAHAPTRLICVFSPALVGTEVNDEDGSFPLLD